MSKHLINEKYQNLNNLIDIKERYIDYENIIDNLLVIDINKYSKIQIDTFFSNKSNIIDINNQIEISHVNDLQNQLDLIENINWEIGEILVDLSNPSYTLTGTNLSPIYVKNIDFLYNNVYLDPPSCIILQSNWNSIIRLSYKNKTNTDVNFVIMATSNSGSFYLKYIIIS